MELLPKSHTEFTSPAYWDSFFKKRGHKAFEWYGEYNSLCGVLHKYIKPSENVLMVGCGNSQLSENMYDVGYHSITNIDISDVVIRQMVERNAKKRDAMKFEKMDVTQMTFDDESFSVLLDKGTLDSLAVDEEEGTLSTVNAMFREVSRVLRVGGRYVIISLLQDQVIQGLVKYYAQCCWPIRVHRMDLPNAEKRGDHFMLPVFAVIITKFKSMPNMKQIVEVCSGEGVPQRLDSVEQLMSTVKEIQYYGMVRQQLANRQVHENQLQICLYSSLAEEARYTMWVVDNQYRCQNKFAIFIVPQGREMEWIFSTDAGRKMLSSTAGFQRLVVVALSRDHEYKDMDSIKAELSSKVMELTPPSYKQVMQVPFLSVGEDIGRRLLRHQGHSGLSGDYIVEDVEGEGGHMIRRLVFLANQNVVQSEARLLPAGSGKKKKKGGKKVGGTLQVDKSYLACGHHHAMVAGLALLSPKVSTPQALLVGLGGGPLASFLSHYFPQIHLEAVEIDEEMTKVARDWFGFCSNVTVHIADGLDFISQLEQKGERRDIVLFDVDNKDSSVGLSCPPAAFLQPQFLTTTFNILQEDGVFVLNLVCRDETLQTSLLKRISDLFPCVLYVDTPQEVNKVVFALKSPESLADSADPQNTLLNRVRQAGKRLQQEMQTRSATCEVELTECIAGLTVLSIR